MNRDVQQNTSLRICQQNLNKSLVSQSAFLNMLDPDQFDLALIQKPYIDWLGLTRANSKWWVIYPTGHRDKGKVDKIQSAILVNKRISTNDWDKIDFDSPDVTAMHIHTPLGPLYIFNVYNDQAHDHMIGKLITRTVELETEETRRGERDRPNRTQLPMRTLWAGDFNRHHLFWEREENTHLLTRVYLDATEPLVTALTTFDMVQLLAPGIPTLQANGIRGLTQPDNVFTSPQLAEHLITCSAHPALRPPNTDHFPIHTHLDLL